MKKIVIFILMLLIFLASIGIGYFYLNTRDDQRKESKIENTIIENKLQNEYISTETQEEKISPNAELTKTILYKKCGHEIINTTEAPSEIVNLNEEELSEKYKDYVVETFSNQQISIYEEKDGMCPEHYRIGESDGIINIYRKNEQGEEELYEVTNISLEYLPTDEQEKLKTGIELVGKEELNSILENLES